MPQITPPQIAPPPPSPGFDLQAAEQGALYLAANPTTRPLVLAGVALVGYLLFFRRKR